MLHEIVLPRAHGTQNQVTLVSDGSMKKPRKASTLAVTDCGQPAAGHFSLQLYLCWCRETSSPSALHGARWVRQSPVATAASLKAGKKAQRRKLNVSVTAGAQRTRKWEVIKWGQVGKERECRVQRQGRNGGWTGQQGRQRKIAAITGSSWQGPSAQALLETSQVLLDKIIK